MLRRSIAAGFAFAAAVGAGPLHAQLPRPLIPLQGTGNRVAPFFDGWYRERRRQHHLLVRLLEPEQGDRRDPARSRQLHHAEGVRRPAADDLPGDGAGSRRRRWRRRWPRRQAGGLAGHGRGESPGCRRRRRGPRARSRARRVHRDGAEGLQGRRRLDLAVCGADLRDSRPVEVHRVSVQLAGGDGLDAAAAALRREGPGRARPDRHPGAAAAGQGGHAGRAEDLDHRRRRPRQGADQVRARAAGDERDLAQVRRTRPGGVRSGRRWGSRSSAANRRPRPRSRSRASTWFGSRPTPSAIPIPRPGTNAAGPTATRRSR